MKVLYLTSELYPYIKTGGLADYSAFLTKSLYKNHNIDVKVMLPGYPSVIKELKNKKTILKTKVFKTHEIEILEGNLDFFPFPIMVIKSDNFFLREGNPYVNRSGKEWHDNFHRFAVLSMAPYLLIVNNTNWKPNIVHANDWHTGLFSAYFNLLKPTEKPVSIFTIHNIAYKGLFTWDNFLELDLPRDFFHPNGFEYYNQGCFLKSGVNFSNKIITVSPNYAKELISNEETGMGFKGILAERKKDFMGILNGVDYSNWNPEKDPQFKHNFNSKNLLPKKDQKKSFQDRFGLKVDENAFLITSVSNFCDHKGSYIMLDALEKIIHAFPNVQFAGLGLGDEQIVNHLSELSKKYPKQVIFINKYDEILEHHIISAGDAYVMPSRFEPWGIKHLYAMKYGNVPIVTPKGGLYDTVIPIKNENSISNENGFVCDDYSSDSLIKSIKNAIKIFSTKKENWNKIIINAMKTDFSWDNTSDEYVKLYKSIFKSKDDKVDNQEKISEAPKEVITKTTISKTPTTPQKEEVKEKTTKISATTNSKTKKTISSKTSNKTKK